MLDKRLVWIFVFMLSIGLASALTINSPLGVNQSSKFILMNWDNATGNISYYHSELLNADNSTNRTIFNNTQTIIFFGNVASYNTSSTSYVKVVSLSPNQFFNETKYTMSRSSASYLYYTYAVFNYEDGTNQTTSEYNSSSPISLSFNHSMSKAISSIDIYGKVSNALGILYIQYFNATIPGILNSYYYDLYSQNLSVGIYNINICGVNTSGYEDCGLDYFNLTTNTLLNITVKNYTNASISNFSVSIKDLTTNLISNYSTTSGLVQADVVYGRSYNLTIDNPLYALNYSTKTISTYLDSFTTVLLPNNAFNITIRKESDGSLLYGNTSVSFVSDSGVVSYSSLNGTKIFSGFTADNYSLTFALTGYNSNTRRINLVDRTFNNVNVYFNNGSDILFNFKTASGSSLADVEFNVFTVVNGTLVSIASVKSDITGKAQVSLESSKYYYFTANLSGYTIAPFSLNPVLFSSYDVVMTATGSGSQVVPSAQVVISPTAFYRYQNVDMGIQFISPYDSFTDYNYSITYPNSVLAGSGNNAHGELFNESFNLDNSTLNSNVVVFFEYTLSNGVYYNKTVTYPIVYTYSNRTWTSLGNNINSTTKQDSVTGYYVGERVLIVTIIAIIMFGVGWLVGGAGTGLVFAIIPILFFINSGFVPKQLYYVTLFFAVIHIISKGSDT